VEKLVGLPLSKLLKMDTIVGRKKEQAKSQNFWRYMEEEGSARLF
jgi:hypothetical protein